MAADEPPLEPPVQTPGVVRGAEDQVFGDCCMAEFRCVGFADNDRAGVLQSIHLNGILLGEVIAKGQGGVSGAESESIFQFLDAERNALENAAFLSRQSIIRMRGLGQQHIGVPHLTERAQSVLGLLDPPEGLFHQLHRRDFTGGDQVGDFGQ